MTIPFYKYQGTGNDFVIIDNRNGLFSKLTQSQIAHICHRRFGVGADGLMLLESHATDNFNMKYFNSDGNEGSMCGNGGRCITAFARFLGIIDCKAIFNAVDGRHEAIIHPGDIVSLKMTDVSGFSQVGDDFILNTGSPHYVKFHPNAVLLDVVAEGRKIRNSTPYKCEGINVNFVTHENDFIYVATYERGVEDETLSCGTGVVASSISLHATSANDAYQVRVRTKGGELKVSYTKKDNCFYNIWLTAQAMQVFKGEIKVRI